jgi:hypothetical protein
MITIKLSIGKQKNTSAAEQLGSPLAGKLKTRPPYRRRLRTIVLSGLTVAVIAGGLTIWRLSIRPSAIVNPFSASIMASVQFPLYYPTTIPPGFRIDRSSIVEPQTGVVIFSIDGAHQEKIYVSEEARSTTVMIGNFYKQFKNRKEIGLSDGEVAGGYLPSTGNLVSSRANNTTWVICNTKAHLTVNQMIAMLKSWRQAY